MKMVPGIPNGPNNKQNGRASEENTEHVGTDKKLQHKEQERTVERDITAQPVGCAPGRGTFQGPRRANTGKIIRTQVGRIIADHSQQKKRRRGHDAVRRSEEHTSELQSLAYLVCRLLLEKKK